MSLWLQETTCSWDSWEEKKELFSQCLGSQLSKRPGLPGTSRACPLGGGLLWAQNTRLPHALAGTEEGMQVDTAPALCSPVYV